MVSVENLYWVLYEQLLKPVGMDAFYFYPFGTMKNFSKHEFLSGSVSHITRLHWPHVLFHFDQEPIFENASWQAYDRDNREYWSGKILRILANSEHSLTKHQICHDRGMQDWYFFYHGFAALDWYRDSEFVDHVDDFKQKFSSYNHLVSGKRCYRIALTARLLDLGLQQHGNISFHGTAETCKKEIEDSNSLLSSEQKTLIKHQMCQEQNLPIIVDRSHLDGNYSAHFGHREYRLWQQSFLHLVNETVFYDAKLHLTEKIFKPIVCLRPFVLAAAPGNLAYLRSYGFQTFSPWIDESYDDETDPDKRINLIVTEIEKISNKSCHELNQIYQEMRPVLEYNKQHFFGRFKDIIVDELLNNFEVCIKIWNNGRVDGRELAWHPDIESVKRILLG